MFLKLISRFFLVLMWLLGHLKLYMWFILSIGQHCTSMPYCASEDRDSLDSAGSAKSLVLPRGFEEMPEIPEYTCHRVRFNSY